MAERRNAILPRRVPASLILLLATATGASALGLA